MNTTKKLQQANLDQWAVLCKEQSESGLTVRQWCEQNGYTIHTYNYWKHRLKESYMDSVLPDIEEQLNQMAKHVLITIIKGLPLQLNSISSQLKFLTEQIALMNQRSFGRKTEKLDQMH